MKGCNIYDNVLLDPKENEDESSDEEVEPYEGPDEDRGQTLRDDKTCLTALDPELKEEANRRIRETIL